MGKLLQYIFLLALTVVAFSCKRSVCPAYYTSYNITKGEPEKFFNYFNPDTANKMPVKKKLGADDHGLLVFDNGKEPEPIDDRMFHSQGKDPNGLMRKKNPPLDRLFPRRKGNFMKVVRAKITFPEMDSLEAAELYAVEDSMFDPSHFYRDQLIYMHLYGFEILDSMESRRERNIAKRDSLAAVAKDKKLRKLSKKKAKIEKQMRKDGTLGEDEELSEAEFMKMVEAEELAKEEKRGKKNKKDEDPDDGADPAAPKEDKPKKEKKKKKKDEDGADPPPADDGGGP